MIRHLSTMALCAVLLAACGGAPAAPAPTAVPIAAPTSAPAAPTVAPTTAPAAGETRTITDASGAQVAVPAAPQRVVTLTEIDLDSALALGVTPVGSVNGRGQAGLPAYLGQRIAGIESVGSLAEPSLEQLAALKPDLILAGSGITQLEPLLPDLQKIAPVVKTYATGDDWKQAFAGAAAALGRADEAEAFLAEYESRAAEVRALLPADAPAEASIVRWMAEGPVVMAPTTFASLVLADVGLARPAAHAELAGSHGAHSDPLSLEQLEVIDSGWLFIGSLNAEGSAALDAARANPLFQQLDVVQAGRVATVDGTVWTSVGGPLAALTVLDDVEAAVGGASAAVPAAQDASAAFPVTVAHKYGETTISARPERIVTVGLTDHDALLALGVKPVGVTEWFGEQPYATWPWAQDKLGDAKPVVLKTGESGINFEAIAALKPDAILALYSGLTQEEYDLLTQIAPTIAQPAGYVDYGIPWQELTRTVGTVVGQAAQADALVAGVEAKLAAMKAAHPEFAGASAIVATPYEGIWVYGPEDARGRFLTALGFELPAGLVEITGAEFGGNLSMERADLLNVDVIIWLDPDEAQGPLGGPVYASLPVHTEAREVFLDSYDDPLGAATSFVSVLSLPFLLDGLVPRLAAAVDGDPATVVEQTVHP